MISVVVPVLNEEGFLPDCLRSLKNQDYDGEYEVIVVDNGSRDRSVDIAREYGARVIFSSRPKDVVFARELGARAALGDIVAQADADTVYPGDWLTRIVKHFSSQPRTVGVAGVYVYREPLKFIQKIDPLLRRLLNVISIMIFQKPHVISGANFAFIKEAFLRVGGYDKKSYSPDQYGIASRLSRLGKIVYDPRLTVATSPRRIDIPAFKVILGVFRNIFLIFKHMAGVTPGLIRIRLGKSFSLRMFAKTAPFMLVAAFFAYGYFIPTSPVFGKVYYQGYSDDILVALTFDDGPNEPYTSQILDILGTQGIKATFFAIGINVELYPETARRMVREGHVIGNHSYSHSANHALTLKAREDIKLAQEAITRTVGVTPHLYRPPHGKKSPWELQYLKKLNLVEVTWSATTNDQRAKPPEKLAREIVSKVKPGRIILLHDGYGADHEGSKADKTITVQALPLIIQTLREEGYRFVTVPELLNIPAYQTPPQ